MLTPSLPFIGDDFNLPKLHSLLHYLRFITEYGTTDNYNTETTERLHIDYAKVAYAASNKKEFLPQMILWLERMEKIDRHIIYVNWRQRPAAPVPSKPLTRLTLTQHPSAKAVTLETIATKYHSPHFVAGLQAYLAQFAPSTPAAATSFNSIRSSPDTYTTAFAIWHRIRIRNRSTQDVEDIADRLDAVHCAPARKTRAKDSLNERFDTALIDEKGHAEDTGVAGACFGHALLPLLTVDRHLF